VFLGGARKSTFGDEHSTAAPAAADVTRKEIPLGVTIEWSIPTPVFAIGPWVDDKLVGVLPTAGQTIEARNGKPIRVDTDALGARRERPTPGPLAEFKPGRHRIEWTWKRQG
jgi:hypothetical protein